jgi:hypothetical protein
MTAPRSKAELKASSLNDGAVELFLKEISAADGTIDVSTLKKLGGGGTHDIYRSDQCPGLLLKVMRATAGKDDDFLVKQVDKLKNQYADLYEVFGESRCIIEKRSIQSVKSSAGPAQRVIVSVVPFDPCFESKEQWGFNVEPVEREGALINSRRYLYDQMNKSLLGSNEKPSVYVIKNYPLLNNTFEKIFKLLETDKTLPKAMHEFLTKYKTFYKKTGILLDTIGYENVLFYNTSQGWQFKLGSVIKHDTGALTKEILEKIIKNPEIVKESFEGFTSVYFMPACIRALNACAEKIGMEKVIDDIAITNETIDALAKMHLQMSKSSQACGYARHGNFAKALEIYLQYVPDEKSNVNFDTESRDILGTLYWEHIKKGGKEKSRDEVESYLDILCDVRNVFPEVRQQAIVEAVEGLKAKLLLIDSQKSKVTEHKAGQKLFDRDPNVKREGESDKAYVARLARIQRR